jgi:hypothetical protein
MYVNYLTLSLMAVTGVLLLGAWYVLRGEARSEERKAYAFAFGGFKFRLPDSAPATNLSASTTKPSNVAPWPPHDALRPPDPLPPRLLELGQSLATSLL